MASLRYASIVYRPVLFIIILNISINGAAHFRLPEKHVALFVFGDSIYDPGNNNYINTITEYQANFWPYGKTFFSFPTGRFSDGRLIPDFISKISIQMCLYQCVTIFNKWVFFIFLYDYLYILFVGEYANLPLIPPYLKPGVSNFAYGVNFASGGAGALFETHQGFVSNL